MAPKKRPWFRFYVEAVHDRKLRRLKPEVRWLFVACLAAARQSPRPGFLLIGESDPMGCVDLADFAGMTRRQVEISTALLQEAGVLSFDSATETWFIPRWSDRQYESDDSTPRSRRSRGNARDATAYERCINGDTGSDATPPENREQRTENRTLSLDGEREWFDRLWARFAEHDGEVFVKGGGVIRTRGFFATAAENRKLAHAEMAHALLAENPALTPEEAIRQILAAEVAKTEGRHLTVARPACDICHGKGVYEVEGCDVAMECECKARRAS